MKAPGLRLALGFLVLALAGVETVSAAWTTDRALVVWQAGPKTAKLKQAGIVQVPAGFRFADGYSATRVLKAAGWPFTGREMGMIVPEDGSEWAILFTYAETGHLSESGASSLDPNELLKTLNKKIEAANTDAPKTGKPLLSKYSWEQKPAYSVSKHTLEWVLQTETQTQTNIEYHLNFLGRQGVMEVQLACDLERFHALSPTLKEITDSFAYASGQKYTDVSFQSKVARGDLEGLITGETVKLAGKLGLVATVLLVFQTIFRWFLKLLLLLAIVAVVGAGYFFYKVYAGGKYKKQGAPTA